MIMLDDAGYVYASWNTLEIDSGDLWIFNREARDIVQDLKNEKGEKFRILALTENLNYATLHFSYNDDIIICAFIVSKTAASEQMQKEMERIEKEFEKILRVFDEVRFS
ncbi:MAG: hypothetical protein RBG13Loki_0070 [Promethearchaeota archaeon CR_4]|nr:MAG: hypothetical protein RBG13Loki_0070 [Candidatus Lokiarchaeota archaeon CR_4]